MKIINLIFTVIILIQFLFLQGCKHSYNATASCGAIQKSQTDLGFINASQLTLGSFLGINTDTKRVFPCGGTVKIPDEQKHKETAPSLYSIHYNQKLDISFTGDIPPVDIKASLETYILNSSILTAKNLSSVSIEGDEIGLLNSQHNIIKRVSEMPNNNANNIYYIYVYKIFLADSLGLSLERGSKDSANVYTAKFGDFSLTVNYNCTSTCTLAGKQFGAFFKYYILSFNPEKKYFYINNNANINLSDIDFVQKLAVQ